MGDVRDWGKFIRGRWDWTRFGYESSFPRRIAFTDMDAAVEIDGHRLLIETKHHDGLMLGCDYPDTGQLLFLRDEAAQGKLVMVLYGCGACDDPQAVRYIAPTKQEDQFHDWRGKPKAERRQLLHVAINRAVGIDPKPNFGSPGAA